MSTDIPDENSSDFVHIPSPATASQDFDFVSMSTHSTSAGSGAAVPEGKARLLYCKSHVAIHPTAFKTDNISGYLGVVETQSSKPQPADEEAKAGQLGVAGEGLLVTWVPDEVLERMDEHDRDVYKKLGHKEEGDAEEDGFVFVSVPPPKGEKYAFSVPVPNIYSILVYPPSLSHWYGSATINLTGGISLPTLYFHDDESPLLASPKPSPQPDAAARPTPRARWGFPPILSLLESRAVLVRSRLLQAKRSMGAELWLVNPSKSDREVHEAGVPDEEPETVPTRKPTQTQQTNSPRKAEYPPKPDYPAVYPGFAGIENLTPKQSILTGLSSLTSLSRRKASQLLSHPLAQPVVPHLPPAFKSLVNVPGEWERNGRAQGANAQNGGRGGSDVASEFESARLYLAKWARVVAEEGERARREELAAQARIRPSSPTASTADVDEDLASSLGVFSLLPKSYAKRPVPSSTRHPQNPISLQDWVTFEVEGKDELFVRQQIFRRGFSTLPVDGQALREGWEVLLSIVPWHIGGADTSSDGLGKRCQERNEVRDGKRQVYEGLKRKWKVDADEGRGDEGWKEEWHRIDVDCRRTDRNQPIYAVPSDLAKANAHEKEGSTQVHEYGDGNDEDEEGGMAPLNHHIAALRTILMTYHTYSPELGYVQGMSDLLSPIYVIFDGNEADSFWGLVGVMKMMESNFLRDQSGMKKQLSQLQQLIAVMDPELYVHLERTGSLNLFFTFRWILIIFKREFPFTTIPRLWENLFTGYYSNQFVIFVALAVLQSHREVIIRYLVEFDEVLKYANDLSGTIDLESTLAQAEVLFISFQAMVEDIDKSIAEEPQQGELRQRVTGKGKDKEAEPQEEPEVLREEEQK
ncbi:hypothetical protein B9479_002021 [Cryptococcus floricola]|uniref:Rab-GAP TBC domain-containing protein n=1 Tax=Cryptococcus floricola TaxID=2591691 RepID=A0A5D3B2P0_9TREE|nr:hypothetical protein B9479_002021 [Cryptococcus floricola]